MSELTAIDILINPDEATIEHARKVNARMRQSVPDGYAIDATHQPHITTLQRYVRSADLNGMFEAVGETVASSHATGGLAIDEVVRSTPPATHPTNHMLRTSHKSVTPTTPTSVPPTTAPWPRTRLPTSAR